MLVASLTKCFDSILVRLKVENETISLYGRCSSFDSILVRLKDWCEDAYLKMLHRVSIPYWFD